MKKTVYVDLDGVLAQWVPGSWKGIDHIADPIPGAVKFTQDLSEFADVVIYTTRCGSDMGRGMAPFLRANIVKEWLTKHGFAFADVYIGQGKPLGACYIDDRNVSCCPQEQGEEQYNKAVEAAKGFCLGWTTAPGDKTNEIPKS